MKERKKEYLRCVLAPLRCPLPYRLDVIYISFSTRKDCIEIFRYRSACLLENLADLVSYCQTLIVNNILIAFSPSCDVVRTAFSDRRIHYPVHITDGVYTA